MIAEIQVDQLIRSKRRTVAIEIQKDASLVVRAPWNTSEEVIRKILFKKRSWIHGHQAKIRIKRSECRPKEFKEGENYLFLGNTYGLRFSENANERLVLDTSGFRMLERCRPNAREYFMDWYKEQALLKISERVEFFSSKMDCQYDVIHITNALSRWGSCSSRGSLNFSWRLIMAPIEIVDYVVVHELAHLFELNHSHRFWRLVKSAIPDYEIREEWLKKCGHTLDL